MCCAEQPLAVASISEGSAALHIHVQHLDIKKSSIK